MTIAIRGLFEKSTPKIIAVESEKCSLDQVQRDIYESHRHRIFSIAYYMTGNEPLAEQIMTASFSEAFLSAEKPDTQVMDRALMRQLHSYFDFAVVEDMPPAASENVRLGNVRRTDMEEAIQKLPQVERLVFLLKDVEGYSTEDISQLVEIPESVVNRSLFSARIRLRNVLGRG